MRHSRTDRARRAPHSRDSRRSLSVQLCMFVSMAPWHARARGSDPALVFAHGAVWVRRVSAAPAVAVATEGSSGRDCPLAHTAITYG